MAKNTKALSGPAKRKYFRDVLSVEPGVTPEAAARLTDKFDAELSHMRVRAHVSLRKANPAAEVPSPVTAILPPVVPVPPLPVAEAMPVTSAFDPHAFSLIVVMTRQGAAGLEQTLARIDDPEHLRALARAQHVAIDATLEQPAALRAAIIAGTAQRIADRRAAAS